MDISRDMERNSNWFLKEFDEIRYKEKTDRKEGRATYLSSLLHVSVVI